MYGAWFKQSQVVEVCVFGTISSRCRSKIKLTKNPTAMPVSSIELQKMEYHKMKNHLRKSYILEAILLPTPPVHKLKVRNLVFRATQNSLYMQRL